MRYWQCPSKRVACITHSMSTAWQMFAAGTVTDNAVRDLLVSSVRKYAAAGNTSQPLGDWYDTIASTLAKNNRAEGAVGGHLALVWATCQRLPVYLFDVPSLQLALQSNSSIAPSIPSASESEASGAPPSPGASTTTLTTSASPTGGRPNSAVPQAVHRLGLNVLLFLISSALMTTI